MHSQDETRKYGKRNKRVKGFFIQASSIITAWVALPLLLPVYAVEKLARRKFTEPINFLRNIHASSDDFNYSYFDNILYPF